MAERQTTPEEREMFTAKATEARAQADKFAAEARKAGLEADTAALTLAGANRHEREELAGDKYHHLYLFSDAVGNNSVKACMDRLGLWRRTDLTPEPVEIIFSSPGGDVIAGLVLFDYIQQLRREGHHVTTSALGWAASMAGILLQAGDLRVMARESWLLIHEISFGAGGSMGAVEDTVEWLKRIQGRVLDIFAARCKGAAANGTAKHPLTKQQLERGWRRKDWWLDSRQCVDLGLVDEVR